MPGRWDRAFGFDDGQHRGHVDQLAWRQVGGQLAVFGAVLLLGRLVVGDDGSPWLRVGVVVIALGATLAVRRLRPG